MGAAIEVTDLAKAYGELRAVDGVTFDVGEGEFFGILGPNGAGKTTILEMVEGLRRPDAGTITLLGESPWPRNPGLLPRIGVQLQSTAFFERLTAREQIRTMASLYAVGPDVADEWLERVGLGDKADTRVGDLSGGQAQRLSIACALVHDPEVVFLDEPTAALDPQARRNLWELLAGLNDSGRTVVLTTHYMDEAEALCDRVAIIDHGRILELDTPANLVRGLDAPTRITVATGQLTPEEAGAIAGVDEVRGGSRRRRAAHPRARRRAHRTGPAGAPGRHPGADRHPRGRLPRPHRPRVPSMTATDGAIRSRSAGTQSSAFSALSLAIVRGFLRDRASVFFAIVFPLMFLVLFGGLFADQSQSKVDMIAGRGRVVHRRDAGGARRRRSTQTFEITRTDDLDAAIAEVKKGDADVAVEMQGDTLVAHYTQTDQVKAAVTQGVLQAFVDSTNVALSGRPPTYRLEAERVEDDSLKTIQYVTPGLLGWAVAMSASFGAAATLNGWRNSKLLRRLQLVARSRRHPGRRAGDASRWASR